MPDTPQPIRLIALGHRPTPEELRRAEIIPLDNPQAAVDRLSRGDVAGIVASPDALADVLAGGGRDTVLARIREGVCVTDPDGHIRWSNQAFMHWGAELAERVMRLAERVARRIQTGEHTDGPPLRYTARERTRDRRHAEITVSPILGDDHALTGTVAVVADCTAQVVLQQRIGAIEEAGRKLLHLEPEMVARMAPDERLGMLQQQIIELTRNMLRFDHFRIRLIDPDSGRLDLVLTEGLQETDDTRELRAEKVGSGISGYVAATGQPYICNDVTVDPRYLPGLADAGSSLTVPLWYTDKVIGTFNVESAATGAFGQQDLQMLEIFSHYAAQALVTLQLLVAEKVSTTDQLAADVTDELNGPLEAIDRAVGELRAQAVGYDAETRARFDRIAEAADAIRTRVRQVTDAKRPVSGSTRLAHTGARPLVGMRMLVADDEQTIRQTLSEILTGLGAGVDLADNGATAAEMGCAKRYDLVLADIRMPGRNGYEVFAAIREVHPHVPIILMTAFGYDPAHSIVKARDEGLQAVLFKPFKIHVLYEEIGQALGVEMQLSL